MPDDKFTVKVPDSIRGQVPDKVDPRNSQELKKLEEDTTKALGKPTKVRVDEKAGEVRTLQFIKD